MNQNLSEFEAAGFDPQALMELAEEYDV
jgi:hypothetical protein